MTKPEEVHGLVAKVGGALAIAIQRRKISRAELKILELKLRKALAILESMM